MGSKKILKGGLVEMYKRLPEANAIPDIIWTAEKQLNRMDEIKRELAKLREDYTWNTIPKMIGILKRDWTIEELKKAGFIE